MFKFRLHFTLANSSTLGIQKSSWRFSVDSDNYVLDLHPLEENKKISDVKELVLIGENFNSKEEAFLEGNRWRDALQSTLIHFGQGANLGNDKVTGGFTDFVRDYIFTETGSVLIDDYIGLNVYDGSCSPLFAQAGPVTLSRSLDENQFSEVLLQRFQLACSYSPKERLAIRLYNDSFFSESGETRFLLLVMAIEALLEPKSRQDDSVELVNEFIKEVASHPTISETEKLSLQGSLKWLLKDSISKTGRDLSTLNLGNKKYLEKEADKFFTYCYGLRSKLIHGAEERPSDEEIGIAAANLEVFVADLLDKIITSKPT